MKKNSIKKVALDMYIEQMKWSVWFIGIIIAVYIGLNIAGQIYDFDFIDNLLGFSEGSSIIYMFVIGIIAGATFLPHLLKLGVTRTHCFYGTVVAAILISISLPLIFSLFSGLEYLLLRLFDFKIAEPVSSNFTASFFLFSLNIFMGYLLGWLINVGFYKFNWVIGLFFIALANGLITIHSIIWKNIIVSLFSIDIDAFETKLEAGVQLTGLSFLIPALESLALILIILIIIRTTTKRIPIKIK
ncbi:MAG: hypothetical protein PHY90_07095 [Desulfitobacteriaceae bacterium]|nr:hypothetical protein [Desulfitobacteriaceae bacterium]